MTRTRPRLVAAIAVAALLLGAAACSDDDEPTATNDGTTEAAEQTTADDGGNPDGSTESTEAADESTESTEAAAEGVSIATSDTDLGTILVDAQGNTLYMFANDTQGEASTCTGGCAGAWPALNGPITAGDGVDESLIGTVGEQATYDGWPLYYYAEDTAPGDTNGQGSGGVWWVIDPQGDPIES